MKFRKTKTWAKLLGTGLMASATVLSQAHAQLVYEDSVSDASVTTRVDDRAMTREALNASEKARATVQAQRVQQVPAQLPQVVAAPVAVVAPVVMEAPVAQTQLAQVQEETQHYSKSELLRRERQREELKNEDILQERLEELRLRDERRRTDAVLGKAGTESAAPASVAASSVMQQEMVVAPVTDHPGVVQQAPVAAAAPAPVLQPLAGGVQVAQYYPGNSEGNVSRTSLSAEMPSAGESTRVSISPRAGLSNMVGQGQFFEVKPHFAAGVAAEIAASDYISFQVGYTFNEYGISMASSNPYVAYQAQYNMAYGTGASYEGVIMKQNVLDAGLKLHLLDSSSRLRPFVGGGGAYSKSFVNFNSQILQSMAMYTGGRNLTPDYDVSSFLGYLSGGLDIRVAKNISVGTEFKYYAVLSASESNNFNSYYGAMYYNPNPYMGYAPQSDSAIAGSSLARTSFYSILGNVTFSF